MNGYPEVTDTYSEDTGGHCMVDFIVFDNGTYVTLDDGSASLHANPYHNTELEQIYYTRWYEKGENALYDVSLYDDDPVLRDLEMDYESVEGCYWVTHIEGNLIMIEDSVCIAVYPTLIDVVPILALDTRIPYFDHKQVSEQYVDEWIERLHDVNLDYHFDDTPSTVIHTVNGKTEDVFTKLECIQLEHIMAYMYPLRKAGYDPFEKLVELSNL